MTDGFISHSEESTRTCISQFHRTNGRAASTVEMSVFHFFFAALPLLLLMMVPLMLLLYKIEMCAQYTCNCDRPQPSLLSMLAMNTNGHGHACIHKTFDLFCYLSALIYRSPNTIFLAATAAPASAPAPRPANFSVKMLKFKYRSSPKPIIMTLENEPESSHSLSVSLSLCPSIFIIALVISLYFGWFSLCGVCDEVLCTVLCVLLERDQILVQI